MRCTITILFFMLINTVWAAKPVWTFTPNPLYPPSHSITSNNNVTIQYTVTNQSQKTHTLSMQSIPGITQDTSAGNCPSPFQLNYQQSCKLTLIANGASLPSNIYGGPVVCEGENTLQCYQPAPKDSLNIRLIQPTLFAGTASGYLYTSQDNGSSWLPTTAPASGYAINSIYSKSSGLYIASSDGHVYYSNNDGYSWASTTSPDNSAINGVFVLPNNNIYVGTQFGGVFYSTDQGKSWNQTNSALPLPLSAVNSLFITDTSIYVARENGQINVSTDNGATWQTLTSPLGNYPLQNIYVANNQLYVNTHTVSSNSTLPPGTINIENLYVSDNLTPSSWTLFSWISFSFFVNSDASKIFAGTQNGHVFSLSTGDNLGFILYSPITSVFYRNL